jgi:hypothetical protein
MTMKTAKVSPMAWAIVVVPSPGIFFSRLDAIRMLIAPRNAPSATAYTGATSGADFGAATTMNPVMSPMMAPPRPRNAGWAIPCPIAYHETLAATTQSAIRSAALRAAPWRVITLGALLACPARSWAATISCQAEGRNVRSLRIGLDVRIAGSGAGGWNKTSGVYRDRHASGLKVRGGSQIGRCAPKCRPRP